jgi:hypothetical protein
MTEYPMTQAGPMTKYPMTRIDMFSFFSNQRGSWVIEYLIIGPYLVIEFFCLWSFGE